MISPFPNFTQSPAFQLRQILPWRLLWPKTWKLFMILLFLSHPLSKHHHQILSSTPSKYIQNLITYHHLSQLLSWANISDEIAATASQREPSGTPRGLLDYNCLLGSQLLSQLRALTQLRAFS